MDDAIDEGIPNNDKDLAELNEDDNDNTFDDKNVKEIQDSIRDAAHYGSVFDSAAMAQLSPASVRALARLRAYKPPPFPTWDKLPVSRRAAVLLLLFADRRGDLRVVITMRAASLRNYSGHAAFPGGKADDLLETPFQISRREAYEEIGLPNNDSKIPKPFRIEHLCELPYNLAKTELAVRPCVAFLHADSVTNGDATRLIPILDAKEVAAVFSAPFHNFLRAEDEVREGEIIPGNRSDWYQGQWVEYHGDKWKMHHFYVPIDNQLVTKPKAGGIQKEIGEHPDSDEAKLKRYKVWGMTARILIDTARVAYGENPDFEFNDGIGDEPAINRLFETGRMRDTKKPGSVITREDIQNVGAKMFTLADFEHLYKPVSGKRKL